jgi:iron(III) transport system substrate-binding protein
MAGPAAAKDKNAFSIANPALSGAAYLSVSRLVSTFDWEFIEKLKANGAKMGQDSGDLKASIAVDYIAAEKIRKGAPLRAGLSSASLVRVTHA